MLLDIASNPASGAEQFPDWLVVVMGLCTVFVCLVALIVIIALMSAAVRGLMGKKSTAPAPSAGAAPIAVIPAAPTAAAPQMNSQEMVAAVGVAIAENMGTDVSRIRIHSIRPIGGTAPASHKQQLVAAIGVAVAENMGTDVSRIRIHSIKKI